MSTWGDPVRPAAAGRRPSRSRARPRLRQLEGPATCTAMVLALAVVVRLPFVVGRAAPDLPPDTHDYFAAAHAALAGGVLDPTAGQVPRSAGYPLFVALCSLLPGRDELGVVLVQHLLGVALAGAAFLLVRRLLGAPAAWVCGLYLAVSPGIIGVEDDVLPDFLLGALLCAAAGLLASRAAHGRLSRRHVVLAATLLAAASLVKPVAQVALLALPAALLLCGLRRGALVRATALAAVVAGALLAPWVVPATLDADRPSFDAQAGLTLFNRVFEVDGRPVPQTTSQGALVAGVATTLQPGQRLHAVALDRLREQYGYTVAQAAGVERRLAQEAIRAAPVAYGWRTVQGLQRYLVEARPTSDAARAIVPRTGSSPGIDAVLWSGTSVAGWGWWVLSLNGFGLVFCFLLGTSAQRRAAGAAVAVVLPVAAATIATHGGLPRYSLELAPAVFALSVAGTALWLGALRRGRLGGPQATAARDAPTP